jgi:hypothetical protein
MSDNLDVRQCIYCNRDPRSTPTQKARKHTYLTKHMDDSHPGCQPIDGVVLCCPQCNRHFVRQDTLQEHIRRMHKVHYNPFLSLANDYKGPYNPLLNLSNDYKGPYNPLLDLANVAEQERIRIEENKRRVQEHEGRTHDQARHARAIHQYRKNINKSPYPRRQDRRRLIPDTIAEESGDYEFKAKRSRKTKKSAKRSRKTKKSVKRSRKTKKSVKR